VARAEYQKGAAARVRRAELRKNFTASGAKNTPKSQPPPRAAGVIYGEDRAGSILGGSCGICGYMLVRSQVLGFDHANNFWVHVDCL
jgi:hypothetical protein